MAMAMAMTARLLQRSSGSAPSILSQSLRSLTSLASCPQLDQNPQAPLSDPRSPAPHLPSPLRSPISSLLGSPKFWSGNPLSARHPYKPSRPASQSFPRCFSVQTKEGDTAQQANKPWQNVPVKHEVYRVVLFSPMEATVKPRPGGLVSESLKIKRIELSQKITYALIPALLLISKTKLTTSVLLLSVYWQIYGFFKEIFLDYVHQEVTREWVLIYFKLLLLIACKDSLLYFNLL